VGRTSQGQAVGEFPQGVNHQIRPLGVRVRELSISPDCKYLLSSQAVRFHLVSGTKKNNITQDTAPKMARKKYSHLQPMLETMCEEPIPTEMDTTACFT
jgi:hypothetical protein